MKHNIICRSLVHWVVQSTYTKSPGKLDHSHSLWRSRLGSALRTALACAIVGVTTLFGPSNLQHFLEFPSFAYVTAVLIVGDATLGDSLRGAVCALCGTLLGLLPALLILFLMRHDSFTMVDAAAAVCISSFIVGIGPWALVAKRIALGQIVIVYVSAYKQAEPGKSLLHPGPAAACTGVGVAAAVLALVFPYPRLAFYQVNQKNKLYSENMVERVRLLVNGICADSSTCMTAWASQSKTLTPLCTKLLQSIKLIEGSMKWESFVVKPSPPHTRKPWHSLQTIETPLKGMQMALSSSTSSPLLHSELKAHLFSLKDKITIKINQQTSVAETELTEQTTITPLQPLLSTPRDLKDLPLLFFLFCMKLLEKTVDQFSISEDNSHDNKIVPTPDRPLSSTSLKEKEPTTRKGRRRRNLIGTKRLVAALKCALSVTLGVVFGVLFNNNNGYWSGLTIAIAFNPIGGTTFRSASLRAHGTALGSVYGILGSFISKNLIALRLLFLLPWIVFTSFLHKSRMYGQAGEFAAITSAIIILGRRNYGSPMIFAVVRLTETYIGLSCSILFELILQPKRASTLARSKLTESLVILHNCFETLTGLTELKEEESRLRRKVDQLKKVIEEAESEPNFWFLPFPTASYKKLHVSLSNVADLLFFMVNGLEILAQESNEMNKNVTEDLKHFKDFICSSTEHFEGIVKTKSLAGLGDIEKGEGPSHCWHGSWSVGEEEGERIVACLLRDSGREMKSEVVLCLATIGFCVLGLMREVKEIEKGIVELLQWGNSYTHINLHEISCKLKAASD